MTGMPSGFILDKIGHVLLGVSDVERSTAFYRDKLGMKLLGTHPGIAFFHGGGVTLMLSAELVKASSSLTGATEIVFAVENVQAAYAALQARGVEFLREPRQVTPTDWAANFRDPDGHLLSVFGPQGG